MSETTDSDGELVTYSTNTWNLARSIASDCITVIQTAREYNADDDQTCFDQYHTLKHERDVWPFSSLRDMVALMEEAADLNAENIDTSDIARSISTRIQEDPTYEFINPNQEVDNKTAINNASSETAEGNPNEKNNPQKTTDEASKQADSENTGESDEPERFSDTPETLSVEEINSGSGSDSSNSQPTFGNTPFSPDQTTTSKREGRQDKRDQISISETHIEIAERFFECFVDSVGEVRYSSVVAEYDVPFPSRATAQVETVNSRGGSREERIENLAEWVEWWYGSPEQIEEVNEFGAKPMGMSSGSR